MEQIDRSIWQRTQPIHSDWLDYRSRCRLSAFMLALQQVADEHVAQMGVDRHRMLEWGMTWMLITMEVRLDRWLDAANELHISTWHKKTAGVQWYRDYVVADDSGERIAAVQSVWALVDLAKRKLLRPSALPVEIASCPHASVGDSIVRLQLPDETPLFPSHVYTVRYSGLDVNGHLNNARYADLCLDALTWDELESLDWRRFHITYYHEAVFGDEISISRSERNEAGEIYFRGVSRKGNRLFEACLE